MTFPATLHVFAIVLGVAMACRQAPANAPQPHFADAGAGCADPRGGRLAGTVVDDSTRRPVEAAQVLPQGAPCAAITDRAGQFVIDSVFWGDYLVKIQRIGYQSDTIRVRLRPESTVHLTVQLRSLGPRPVQNLGAVSRCRDQALAAAAANLASDRDSLLVATFCTAFTLADLDQHFDSYCLSVPLDPAADAVASAFGGQEPRVRPAVECHVDKEGEVVDRDGKHAIAFSVDGWMRSPDGLAIVEFSHHVAPLWAGGWRCTFRRTERSWEPEACEGTWIS